jgi:ribonuclease E
LPFLRFTRDKRGYETTSLVYASRQRGRARQRILYWFRTPPGVKVGRPALDEEAIRWIEEHNPDIEFDWQKILAAQPPPAPAPDDGRSRRPRAKGERSGRDAREGRDGRNGRENRRRQDQAPQPRSGTQPPQPSPNVPVADAVESEISAIEEPAQTAAFEDEETSFSENALTLDDAPPSEDMPAIDALEQITHPDAEELVPPSGLPIESIVGKEQLTRLRARYAELQARITERGGEAARVEELRAKADALNPDTWVTEEEARAGLQEFDVRIRELRLALGLRPRRRSRRGGRRRRRGGQGSQARQPGVPASDQPAGSDHPDQPGVADQAEEPPETSNSEDFSD